VRLQTYGPKGALLSDVRYSNWQPPDTTTNSLAEYPRSIRIDRPHDEYRLDLAFTKVSLNETLTPDRFELKPPEGFEVTHLTDAPKDKKP
jgi:hypothetical protein